MARSASNQFLLLFCRRDAIPRHEEGERGNWIGRSVMIFAHLLADSLLESAALRKRHQRTAIGNAGPERAAEQTGKQVMQVGMEKPARGQAIVGLNQDHAAAVFLARPFQAARPRKLG